MRTTNVGMDIHKNFIQAAAMDEQGNILKNRNSKPQASRSNDL
jgi:predicted NBD/HSP70 family sugar kinase